MKAKIPGGGGGRNLNVEVIGMLVGNFLENPKKYSDLDFKALKIPKLLAQYPKKIQFGNFSFLLDMENE